MTSRRGLAFWISSMNQRNGVLMSAPPGLFQCRLSRMALSLSRMFHPARINSSSALVIRLTPGRTRFSGFSAEPLLQQKKRWWCLMSQSARFPLTLGPSASSRASQVTIE